MKTITKTKTIWEWKQKGVEHFILFKFNPYNFNYFKLIKLHLIFPNITSIKNLICFSTLELVANTKPTKTNNKKQFQIILMYKDQIEKIIKKK